jgi:hypothetical protein
MGRHAGLCECIPDKLTCPLELDALGQIESSGNALSLGSSGG